MSNPQNYHNHIRYYPPHHFVLLPLCTALVAGCAFGAIHYTADRPVWIALTAIAVLLTFVSVMMRQHYALGNQNRIVRLEMRLRYFQLTGQRFEPLEAQLSFGQIAALRFASDAELAQLTERARSEGLSPDTIKKSINTWLPDHMRV